MRAAFNNKRLVLWLLIGLAIFLRFYNFTDSTQFQGDQGRDALIVADIIRLKDPVFIGPVTSIGNMYLGPLYYYFMLPFLWLTYPSPLGPAYAVAALGVLTVWLIYKLGKEMLGERAALIAAFFYTFSATILAYSRFSWNPNPAPIASLLMVYFTYLAWKKEPKYWLGVIIAFSVLLQLHYLTLLTLPAAGVIWLVDLYQRLKQSNKQGIWLTIKPMVMPSLMGLVFLLASLSPLVLFDIKHQGSNLRALQALTSGEENFVYNQRHAVVTEVVKVAKETEGRGMHIFFEYMIGKNRLLNQGLLYLLAAIFIINTNKKHRQGKYSKAEWVLFAYLGFGILGTAFYEHSIFDHYISYLFPLTALSYGYLFTRLKPKPLATIALLAFSAYFLQYNLPKLPLKSLGWTVNDIQATSQAILERIEPGEKYNVVLLSENRDLEGQNYRYFMTTGHTRPVPTEERGDVDTLVIINEEKKADDVLTLPIYEIVTFPDKDQPEVFQIENGPEIILLHRTTQEPANPLE